MAHLRSERSFFKAIAGVAMLVVPAGLFPWRHAADVPTFAAPRHSVTVDRSPAAFEAYRTDAMKRAQVWSPVDPAVASLDRNPPDLAGTLSGPVVHCRFQPTE